MATQKHFLEIYGTKIIDVNISFPTNYPCKQSVHYKQGKTHQLQGSGSPLNWTGDKSSVLFCLVVHLPKKNRINDINHSCASCLIVHKLLTCFPAAFVIDFSLLSFQMSFVLFKAVHSSLSPVLQ